MRDDQRVYVKQKTTRRTRLKRMVMLIIKVYPLFYFCRLAVFYFINSAMGVIDCRSGLRTKIHPSAILREPQNIVIGDDCLINHGCVLHGGKNAAQLLLGDHVQLGPYVQIFCFNHDTRLANPHMMVNSYSEADVIIGSDVWIGAGSIILAGVKVGDGAVIGAGSIVVDDIPENAVVASPKAKVIGRRQ